ncbi:MutT/nudix family phosphohydrolase [Lacticaseibacillus rhamnosus]|nr:MutT/nudix family phosphohydrolase [Lacticaseibacillus rhamnosus]
MTKPGSSRPRPLMLRFLTGLAHAHFSITRSPAQKPAHKDLERNDQARVITSKAAYAPVSNRAGSRSL